MKEMANSAVIFHKFATLLHFTAQTTKSHPLRRESKNESQKHLVIYLYEKQNPHYVRSCRKYRYMYARAQTILKINGMGAMEKTIIAFALIKSESLSSRVTTQTK